jgi:AcrR family transcriptional regulator
MTTTRQAGTARRPRGRHGLDAERIAATAADFLDRHGLEALTMRRLAEELGVGTMTLYGYFRDKDELLDAVVERHARRLRIPAPEGPWRERLRVLLHGLHHDLARHPSAVHLRASRPIMSPAAMRVGEAGMRALRDAGFDAAEAASAWRALFNLTFAFAVFTPSTLPAEARRGARAALAALPADEYPTLAETAQAMVDALGGAEQFENGLELLLDGLQARLDARGAG